MKMLLRRLTKYENLGLRKIDVLNTERKHKTKTRNIARRLVKFARVDDVPKS